MVHNSNIEELLEIYRTGNKYQREAAMDAIISENDNLIIHIINKYYSSYRHHHMEDMRQEGRQALFEHVADYDSSRGKFSTFITPYIIDAIKNYVCSIHGISTHYASQIKHYRRAIESLRARGVENPSWGDIAEEMHVGIDAVQRVHEMSCRVNTISIEGDGKDKELCSAYSNGPDSVYEQAEFHETIANAIKNLPREEAAVIRETFFGNDSDNKELPLIDVANRLNMDVSTVRRLKNLALRRLYSSLSRDDFTVSHQRRELEDFADNMTLSFILPEEAVEANIEIALSFED